LDPDQSPLAEQLEALDELQVSVTLELMETEFEFEDKETLAEGLGAGPESDPDPPPPPHPDIRIIARTVEHLLLRNIIKYYFLRL